MCFQQYWDFEMPQQADEKKNGPDKDITSIMNKPESNKNLYFITENNDHELIIWSKLQDMNYQDHFFLEV